MFILFHDTGAINANNFTAFRSHKDSPVVNTHLYYWQKLHIWSSSCFASNPKLREPYYLIPNPKCSRKVYTLLQSKKPGFQIWACATFDGMYCVCNKKPESSWLHDVYWTLQASKPTIPASYPPDKSRLEKENDKKKSKTRLISRALKI